jgi:thymidylate synthase
MRQYLDLLQTILDTGEKRSDRTGVGTLSIFGAQLRFDLSKGFPAVTTKKLAWKAVKSELLWFLSGSTDERTLAEIHYGESRNVLKDKTTIWTANADKQGKDLGYANSETIKQLGPIYGKQWRRWLSSSGVQIDQIENLIEGIFADPYGRRHILSAWNVAEIDLMSLPPCHCFAQFYVSNDRKLSCQFYQRSADFLLGSPFNIASYALLTHMIAQVCNLEVGDLVYTIGDAHLYFNHIEAAKEQLTRTCYSLPTLSLNKDITNIDDFDMEDIILVGYKCHAAIKADMAV